MVGIRMSKDLQKEIRAWAARQEDNPPLARAIRRMCAIVLKTKHPKS